MTVSKGEIYSALNKFVSVVVSSPEKLSYTASRIVENKNYFSPNHGPNSKDDRSTFADHG